MGKKNKSKNKKETSARLLRDWLFERMVEFLIRDEFPVVVIDFKNLLDKNKAGLLGLTDYEMEKIFLNVEGGAIPKILIHELGHIFFDDIVDDEARAKTEKGKREEWSEDRIYEFENCFYASLTQGQIKILQNFIDEIKKRRA